MPNLSGNFGNRNPQDSHKNQYPSPALNFGMMEPQYNDKLRSNLPWKCHIFTIGTHTEDTVLLVRSSDSCYIGFVWIQLPRVSIKTRSNDVFTEPAYCAPISLNTLHASGTGELTLQTEALPTSSRLCKEWIDEILQYKAETFWKWLVQFFIAENFKWLNQNGAALEDTRKSYAT